MNYLYLCGPITDEPYTREWREEVKRQLRTTRINCLDPLRGKASIKGLGFRSNIPAHLFVARDWMDVRHSQLVLVNLLFIP